MTGRPLRATNACNSVPRFFNDVRVQGFTGAGSFGAQPRVVFADDGSVMREVTVEAGRSSVLDFARRSGWPIAPDLVQHEAIVHVDQWSVSGVLDEHRPLLRYALNV
jgi:hypothetical protein